MSLVASMTLMNWAQLLGMIVGGAGATIVTLWKLGRGNAAEDLLKTPAMKLERSNIEEFVRKEIDKVVEKNDFDHRHILAEMPGVAEHKAAIAVQPAIEKMIAVEHRQARMEAAQETARVEHREDMNKIFGKLDALKDDIRGIPRANGVHA